MPSRPNPEFEFVQSFVDALTIRPFLNDLRRTRRSEMLLQALLTANADEMHEFRTATAA